MTIDNLKQSQHKQQHNDQYKKNCTLVVPDLLCLPSLQDGYVWDEGLQLKDLELFLARAKCRSHKCSDFDAVLFNQFDVAAKMDQELAVAPIAYLADTGNEVTGWCLRADPVYLTPDRDELMLSGPEVLSLVMSEAEHLATELNVLFEEDGWRIEAITPTRWYLHLPNDPEIKTSALSLARGKSISRFLPAGPKGKLWHRIMNEVQMVLHASQVNVERQSHGQLPVSSLWFWGGGELPVYGHSRWSQVWSDEVLSLGLAQATRTPRFSVPENAKEWLAQVNAPGEHLIVCDDILLQRQLNDSDAWRRALQEFEVKWLTPLLKALRKGEIDRLSLTPCDGRTFNLTSNRLKYWWSWRKPIKTYCR